MQLKMQVTGIAEEDETSIQELLGAECVLAKPEEIAAKHPGLYISWSGTWTRGKRSGAFDYQWKDGKIQKRLFDA